MTTQDLDHVLQRQQCCFSPVQLEFYRQGSESCRNYSPLTQRTRTIALIAAIAAIAAPLSSLLNVDMLNQALLPAGLLLAIAATSLLLVDWHYQSAFEAKRDVLALIEASLGEEGPWTAHLKVRGSWRDCLASYLPFALLFAIAVLSAGAQVASIGGARSEIVFRWSVWLILAVEAVALIIAIRRSTRRHKQLAKRLLTMRTEATQRVTTQQ